MTPAWRGFVSLMTAIALAVLTACGTTGGSPAPAHVARAQPLPRSWPAAFRSHGVCTIKLAAPAADRPSALPAHANSAALLWFPGMNARPCRTYHSDIGARRANALLADLEALPPPPTGVIHCPMDDGSFVQVWFVTKRRRAVSFRIGLRGCAFYRPTRVKDLGTWPTGMPR